MIALGAFPYYQGTGTFGGVRLEQVAVRNVAVGEGDVEGPTGATLVLASVRGREGSLTLSAQSQTQTVRLGSLFVEGQDYVVVPWLLYDTGWVAVEIVATLRRETQEWTRRLTVPFTSGE